MQGRVVSGVHARYIVNGLQSLRVLSGSMCSLSSKSTARSIYFSPIAASKSSNIDSGQAVLRLDDTAGLFGCLGAK